MLILALLLCGPVVHRSLSSEMQLSCEREGFVDVRDFGACGLGAPDEAEAIRNAELLAKICIPGRVLPVHYCPAKPAS